MKNFSEKKEIRSMMTNYTKMTLLGAALAAFLLPASAQTSNNAPTTSAAPVTNSAPAGNGAPASGGGPASAGAPASVNTPAGTSHTGPESAQEINQRKQNQQKRIAGGVADGQLTAGETHTLEKQESGINQEEKTMRSEDDGHLTTADRSQIQKQQNQMSKEIYQDKHNAQTQNTDPTTKVGRREEHEQQRIAGGVKNGELTAGQTAHLEKQESNINKEVKADRAANGGHLTQAEKAQINRQQNKVGHQIYKDKHGKK
jgi:hypothetical protein